MKMILMNNILILHKLTNNCSSDCSIAEAGHKWPSLAKAEYVPNTDKTINWGGMELWNKI